MRNSSQQKTKFAREWSRLNEGRADKEEQIDSWIESIFIEKRKITPVATQNQRDSPMEMADECIGRTDEHIENQVKMRKRRQKEDSPIS